MAIWQFDFYCVAQSVAQSRAFSDAVAAFLPELSSWGEDLRLWGEMDGNRIDSLSGDGGADFRIRVDLRSTDGIFLTRVVRLIVGLGLEMRGEDDRLIEGSMESLMKAIEASDALRFVQDPEAFMRSIDAS
jgi:hypothetical protein